MEETEVFTIAVLISNFDSVAIVIFGYCCALMDLQEVFVTSTLASGEVLPDTFVSID